MWCQNDRVSANNLPTTVHLVPLVTPSSLEGYQNSFAVYTKWFNMINNLWPRLVSFCQYKQLSLNDLKTMVLLYKAFEVTAGSLGEWGCPGPVYPNVFSYLSLGTYFSDACIDKDFISTMEKILEYYNAGKDGVW